MTLLFVHNPHGLPLAELPTIFGYTAAITTDGNIDGRLVAEDGTALGQHVCSSEQWARLDLGVVPGGYGERSRHPTFKAHYPRGYRMVFVSLHDADRTELNAALANQRAREGWQCHLCCRLSTIVEVAPPPDDDLCVRCFGIVNERGASPQAPAPDLSTAVVRLILAAKGTDPDDAYIVTTAIADYQRLRRALITHIEALMQDKRGLDDRFLAELLHTEAMELLTILNAKVA